jgi:LAS superfamily LD-carboxypeptidase LdcB
MTLPARLALALLLLFATVAPIAAQDAPWIVFTDHAAVRTAPRLGADEIGELQSGDTLRGEIVVDHATSQEWIASESGSGDATAYVALNDLHRVHPDNVAEGNLPIGHEVVNRWWGLPLDYEPSDLVEIPSRLAVNPNRHIRLRREPLAALERMLSAALDDGVDIQVLSAYRSADYQRGLLMHAVVSNGPGQRTVARPGHSEHQLGTTVDLSDPAGRYATDPAFGDTPQGQWLAAHAAEYGFFQSYTDRNEAQTGYACEPWHFRYMGPSRGQRLNIP